MQKMKFSEIKISIFFLLILLTHHNIYSQNPGRYQFTYEELESEFAFSQLENLIKNNKYCISYKVTTNVYGSSIFKRPICCY